MAGAAELRIGIIGGTGMETVLEGQLALRDVCRVEPLTPFGAPSAPITTGRCAEVPVAMLARHGPDHGLPPAAVPARANIFALKALGCTHVVAFGATGSLREEIAPGDLVVCDQLIDRTDGRPRSFFERAAVHVEFSDPFCPILRAWLLAAAAGLPGAAVHARGTYVCIEGPSFSTRAEAALHRQWGGDVVGMTALPEARLAREAEMAYALVALPTDQDCWHPREAPGSLLEAIMANLRRATASSMALLSRALADVTALRERPSPAHDALRLAIWTARDRIAAEEVHRLRPLWGRYF